MELYKRKRVIACERNQSLGTVYDRCSQPHQPSVLPDGNPYSFPMRRHIGDDEDDDLYTDLTEQQEKVLDYVETCIEGGLPPTRAEIAKHFGFRSPNAAQESLELLQKKGRIQIMAGISRGIRLL